jgi:xylan 1,4-beta-xylosidase
MNLFSGFAVETSQDPLFQAAVTATMGPSGQGLLRYHRSQQMEDSTTTSVGWIESASTPGACAWNVSRIEQVLSGLPWLNATTSQNRVMMGITGWPRCMANASNNGALLSNSTGAFAKLCADLVTIVNGQLGLQIPIWELTNELDSNSAYTNNMSVVGTIVSEASKAMRAAQAAIDDKLELIIGGPAFARPDLLNQVASFISTSGGDIDFLSYHGYATGDGTLANSSLWSIAQSVGGTTDGVRRTAVEVCNQFNLSPQRLCKTALNGTGGSASRGDGKGMLLLHDEWNISWNPPDSRMGSGVGAVFDALAIRSVQQHGAAVARWNLADGWYGACNGGPNYERRPPSYSHEMMARYARGLILPSASFPDDGQVVAVFATASSASTVISGIAPASDFAIVFINRSGEPASVSAQTVWGSGSAPPASTVVGVHSVDDNGLAESQTTWAKLTAGGVGLAMQLTLDSVTVVEWNATHTH